MLPLEATIMNGRQSLETVNSLGPGSNGKMICTHLPKEKNTDRLYRIVEHLASDCPPKTVSTDTHQASDTHVTRSRAPSICSPPRTHRDSISSVSTSSTIVETEAHEGFYAAPDLESGELLSGRTIPAFKTPRSVGTVIADMLLKKTYIHRPSSHVFTAEPETDSSISFQRELETLHRRFDELSSIIRQQQMGGNPILATMTDRLLSRRYHYLAPGVILETPRFYQCTNTNRIEHLPSRVLRPDISRACYAYYLSPHLFNCLNYKRLL